MGGIDRGTVDLQTNWRMLRPRPAVGRNDRVTTGDATNCKLVREGDGNEGVGWVRIGLSAVVFGRAMLPSATADPRWFAFS